MLGVVFSVHRVERVHVLVGLSVIWKCNMFSSLLVT